MAFKRLSTAIVVRLMLILASMLVFAFLFGKSQWFFSQIIVFILIVLQSAGLIFFLNKTNREITRFLTSLRNNDFSLSLHETNNDSVGELKKSLNETIAAFRDFRGKKQSQENFLKTIVGDLHSGILVIKEPDAVVLMNKKSETLWKVKSPKHTQKLKQSNETLYQIMDGLKPEKPEIYEHIETDKKQALSISMQKIKLSDGNYRIYTFRDIKSELEKKETEAWQKLIRILNHEIMNSATPISSMTETVLMILQNEKGARQKLENLNDNDLEDIRICIRTIHQRNKGLMKFVSDFRKLARLPKPEHESVKLNELLGSVTRLLKADFDKAGISIQTFDIPRDWEVWADKKLSEQVLINLFINAKDALLTTKNPKLEIICDQLKEKALVKLVDNGCGIQAENMNKILTPFFTTKENGSGIGLSLSKQIMLAQHGDLSIQSEEGEGTTVSLEFRKY